MAGLFCVWGVLLGLTCGSILTRIAMATHVVRCCPNSHIFSRYLIDPSSRAQRPWVSSGNSDRPADYLSPASGRRMIVAQHNSAGSAYARRETSPGQGRLKLLQVGPSVFRGVLHDTDMVALQDCCRAIRCSSA
jgi:hypothetical protein